MFVGYSQISNLYAELDAYPLPRVDDLVNTLASYNVFSTFNLRSASDIYRGLGRFTAVVPAWEGIPPQG